MMDFSKGTCHKNTYAGSLFLWVAVIVVLVFPAKLSALEGGYTDQLVQRALENKVYEKRYWHILLHYKKTLFGTKSLIDDPEFFLSSEGKTNPEKELIATIEKLFSDKVADNTDIDVCNYIARYTWLKEELQVDFSKVRFLPCERVENVNAGSAVLVFPGYYMNNPASMFGHTFLNIRTEFESDLLGHAVNYAARTDETNGFVFAFKGITGLYKGYYSVLPYYKKILEYSDMDKRDIWEYELNLTKEELDRMVRHIRELENVYTDYFFFMENCSYNLLFLFESARPDAHLTDAFSFFVLPIDTVKLMQANGFISNVTFRPSSVTKIKAKNRRLSTSARKKAIDILDGNLAPETLLGSPQTETAEKIAILDLTAEMLKFRLLKKEISKETYKKIFFHVLKTRSKLGKEKHPAVVPVPRAPEKTHRSSLIRAGIGRFDGETYMDIGFRPSFSDIPDPDFPDENGIGIQFFNTSARYYTDRDKLKLERLDIFDVKSLSSRDTLFKPDSWGVRTGFNRQLMGDGRRHLAYALNGGTGVSYFNRFSGLFYAMLHAEINIDDDFDDNFCAGIGVESGIVKRILEPWKLSLHGEYTPFFLGDRHHRRRVSIAQRLRLAQNIHLSADVSLSRDFHYSWEEYSLDLIIYF